MEQTIPLLCKNQEEVDDLIKDGYIFKQGKVIKYLIKDDKR